MPELPEVETVKETLKHQILNDQIIGVDVFYSRMMSDDVKDKLVGQHFKSLSRRGKYIIMHLDDYDLISHLRMEGRYFLKSDEPREKHEHIVFHLASGRNLRYHDTRKFGTFDLKIKHETYTTKPLIALGEEPFDMDGKVLYRKLKKTNKPMKSALLDQSIIAGIGNIYADEILFASHIKPTRKASSITQKQTELLLSRAKGILQSAIEAGGTTIRTYVSSLGVTGRFQLTLMVHQRLNERCYICGDEITKTVIGGRSTFYCKNCQS